MDIVLYSTGCPKCNVLKKKLDDCKLNYKVITDFNIDEMIELGFTQVPILEVDGEKMDFSKANKWINERRGG